MCGVVAQLRNKRAHDGGGMDLIRHRGVRRRTVVTEAGWVGHARLPIVGLGEENDQPVRPDGGTTVAFVGEVFNFKQYDYGADCDLPLVVHTWCEEGPAGFAKFDGFWHVVALDDERKTLSVLCDYLGQKPAYYREDVLAVASEPAALASLAPTTPDEVYLGAVVKWGYCPDVRRTPYAELKRVLPGERVVLGKSEDGAPWVSREVLDVVRPRRREDPDFAVEDLVEALAEAAVLRVEHADVQVAALVSGGLDSAVVWELAQRRGVPIKIYHASNGEERALLDVVGSSNVTVVTPEAVSDNHAIEYMQEPLDLGSLRAQVGLSDAIGRADRERVCLTGDGADELFGGYSRADLFDSQASDVWHELVAWHLPRLDRVMMRNRVEVRSPYLARPVVELALGLPRYLRVDKKVLREAALRIGLPREVAFREKRALRAPGMDSAMARQARSLQLVEKFRQRTWGRA